MSKFEKLDPKRAELLSQGVLHDPIAHLPRNELLTIQFAKFINYFQFDTATEWGGQNHESDPDTIEHGYQRFLEDVDAFGDSARPKWLRKNRADVCWGPDNYRLSVEPCPELGYPFEPYLTVNGAILTVNQASRILSIRQMDLVRLKCSLILDSRVVEHAIRKMMEPRAQWPRIQLKTGGKGRAYRFGGEDT